MPVIILWILFGIAAALAASSRGRSSFTWFILGGFLGPFGLLFALLLPSLKQAPAATANPTLAAALLPADASKQCPMCAETIKAAAQKCRFCGHVFPPEEVAESLEKEAARLKAEGPTEADVERVRETEKRDLEEAQQDNRYWMGSLQTVHLLGWDPARILERLDRAESLDTENIHAALQRYFPDDRYTVVTLLPE